MSSRSSHRKAEDQRPSAQPCQVQTENQETDRFLADRKVKKKRGFPNHTSESIDRHKYTDLAVALSVGLYVVGRCGLKTTSRIIEFLDSLLNLCLPEIPCANSIKNWVEKSGYSIYKEPKSALSENGYAEIFDECMMIGSEKLLLTLGVPAEKEGDNFLTTNDVEVLSIDVKKSWNSETIGAVLDSIETSLGASPRYVISDNASTLTKTVRDKEYTHIRDVSHTFALFMEREYKNDKDFQQFNKEIAGVKFREIMRPSAYLLPPKQRTIARFMNLGSVIDWAEKILKSFHRLTAEEQDLFRFLFNYSEMIAGFQELLKQLDYVSKHLKKNGLSSKNATVCINEMEKLLSSADRKIVSVAQSCIVYLTEESNKLATEESRWHTSSDIIESLFGNYKDRKSPNPLNGVTKQVLLLPVLTKTDSNTHTVDICFKKALEGVFLKDLEQWKDDNLSDNLVVKRRKILKAS